MASRQRHARSGRSAQVFATGIVAFCLLAASGVHVGAQELSVGSPVDPTPTDDQGLRGSGADSTAPGNEPMAATQATDPTGAPKPKLRLRVPSQPEVSTAKARIGAPQLPPLAPYPTPMKLRGVTIDTIDPSAQPAPVGPTVAALPVPPPLRHARADPDPFAPVGYTVGSLRMTPYVEESVGYDSNPDQVTTGVKPSAYNRTEGGFGLLSLWSANQLKADMHAGYDDFFSNPNADRPDANGTVDYRLDATRDIAFDAEGRFAVTTQRPGSPELNVAVEGRPLVSSIGTTLGGNDTLGRLTLGLHGLFDRTDYENGRLPDGTTVVLDDQNFNDYGLDAKVSYELLPTLKPFVELTGDTRVHDRRVDQSGYARDSDGLIGRVGSTFEVTHLLTGTLSAGYEDRSYRDKRLNDLRGPLVDATLVYAATPLTTFTLNATTSFNETNLVGSSGAESRSVSLQISHALLRNLTISGTAAYLNTDYVGSTIVENTYSATLKASYNITRSIVLDASYNYQTLKSTAPSSSFSQDVFLVGLRLQH